VPRAIPPTPPPREDLFRLAAAALANAGDLLADARLLAEAGRFARAHALATLACEELGKEAHCLQAAWVPRRTPQSFWAGFSNHTQKLWHTQTLAAVLETDDPVGPVGQFGQRVRQQSRSAHERKLRGLYVDYADGAAKLPGEITEQAASEAIHRAQATLDRSTTTHARRVHHAEWLAGQPERFRATWLIFIVWFATTDETEALRTVLRDGSFSMAEEMLRRFQQQVESAGGLPAFLQTWEPEL